MTGKGTLTDLERLKAEYAEKFRRAAPKVKRIGKRCFAIHCSTVSPARLKRSGGNLRLAKGTCTRKTCPWEEYRRVLDRTRAWRRDKNRPVMAGIWWDTVERERKKLRRKLK
jgi:hypothetical protein